MNRFNRIVRGAAVAGLAGLAVIFSGPALVTAQTQTPTQQQLTADRKTLSDAQTQLGKAQADLSALSVKLRQVFESSPDFATAAALKQAQGAYDAAKAKVVEALTANNTDYQAAQTAFDAARQRQTAVGNDAAANAEDRINAGNEFLKAASVVGKFENAAFDADQPTKAAKAVYELGLAKVNELRKQFEQGLAKDTDYVTAKAAVDAARKLVNDVQVKVADDNKRDAQARAAAAKVRTQPQQRRRYR